MAYTKLNLTNGEKFTASHLQHIENGIATANGSKLVGKKVSIIGDSISTFSGYNPSGYATFYPKGNVTSVEHTWWKQLINNTGMELLKNCSWSGSECYGDSTSTTDAAAGCSTKRVNDLANGSTNPDIIICYIGINDFFNGVGLSDWEPDKAIPTDSTSIDNFLDAYVIMINKIRQKYKNARVFCTTLMDCPTVKTGYPLINNANISLYAFNEAIKKVANTFGCDVLDLHNCGLNQYNFSSYGVDTTHPNQAGHTLMANKMTAELLAKY